MASKQTLVLVTGGNGGIGYELCRQLLTDSVKHVLLGARSPDKGRAAVEKLQAENPKGTVEFIEVDISNEASITAAAKTVEQKFGRLDALVNNAAVAMPGGSLAEMMTICYKTNAIGTQLMGESFAPLLEKSSDPRMINVSTSQGSITTRLDPNSVGYKIKGIHYRASKAGTNMVTAGQIAEFGEKGFKIWAYCPGFTVSNLGPHNKPENGAKPTSQGAAPIVDLLNGKRDDEAGKFVHEDGQYPW